MPVILDEKDWSNWLILAVFVDSAEFEKALMLEQRPALPERGNRENTRAATTAMVQTERSKRARRKHRVRGNLMM